MVSLNFTPSLRTLSLRRSLALTAALAGPFLTATVPVAAQVLPPKKVNQQITFSASHQNYWGGDFANLHRKELFGGYPNSQLVLKPPFSTDFSLSTSDQPITVNGSLKNSEFGLTLSAYATAGDVTVKYPGNLALTFDPTLIPHHVFSFQTAFSRDPNASNLDITAPGFDATLGGIVKGDISLDGTIHTPDPFPNVDFSVFHTNIDTSFDIFDVQNDLIAPLEADGGLNTTHDLHDLVGRVPAGVVTFEVDDPRVVNFTNNSTKSSPTLSYTGYQQLLNLTGDISNLIGYFGYAYFTDGASLPQGLFNADYNFGVSEYGLSGSLDFKYQLADLYGQMPLGFQQDFTFDAQPKATITLFGPSGKQIGVSRTVLVGIGDSIQIPDTYTDGTPVLPYGKTSVPITVQTTLDFSQNTLHNDTSLRWDPGLYFEPYSFDLTADLTVGIDFHKSAVALYPVIPLATHTLQYTALSSNTTIKPSDYLVSPSTVITTIKYEGTSIDSPTPTLTSLSQPIGLMGSHTHLTLTGSGFIPQSQALVTVNGVTKSRGVLFNSPTSLTVDLEGSDTQLPGQISLAVSNPAIPVPTTHNSNALPFVIAPPGCYLNFTPNLTKVSFPLNDYVLSLTTANNSTVDATDVILSSVTLNGVDKTFGILPLPLGTLKSGDKTSTVFYYSIPAINVRNGVAVLKVSGTYNGRSFVSTSSVRIQ